MYLDGKPVDGAARGTATPGCATTERADLMRLLACLVAAIVYIRQEQTEYLFPETQFVVFVAGLIVLSCGLYLFRRGASRIQPPQPLADALRFIGRRTLEIYAIQLAGSELIVGLLPDPAP
jgi:hypothetical protein